MRRAWLAVLALVLCTAGTPPPQGPDLIIETGPSFPDRVYFAPNSVALSPGDQEILRRWARFLKDNRYGAVIEGHADDSGDADADRTLSARRADAVRQALILLGVPAANLKLEVDGNTRPIVGNADLAERWENRRVVAVPEPIRDGTISRRRAR
jgi:peptidoglycan-associated lipoprotein